MKKRIAMMTAAMMTMSVLFAPAVFAEGSEAGSTSDNPVVFDYKQDVSEDVYEGQWWDTGLGFDIYLPADWVDSDLTEEMVEAGVVHIYGEDGGGANCTITCTEIPAEVADTYDINALGEELASVNTTAMYAELSGIPAVIYANDEACISGFAMLSGDGYLLQGVISAPSDDQYEEYGPVFENITASISPTESEEGAAEETEEAVEETEEAAEETEEETEEAAEE